MTGEGEPSSPLLIRQLHAAALLYSFNPLLARCGLVLMTDGVCVFSSSLHRRVVVLDLSSYLYVSMIVVGREAGQDPTESGNDYKTRKGDGGGRATGPAKKKSRQR